MGSTSLIDGDNYLTFPGWLRNAIKEELKQTLKAFDSSIIYDDWTRGVRCADEVELFDIITCKEISVELDTALAFQEAIAEETGDGILFRISPKILFTAGLWGEAYALIRMLAYYGEQTHLERTLVDEWGIPVGLMDE